MLIDVTPLTLGVETEGGVFSEVLPRGSAVPWQAPGDRGALEPGAAGWKGGCWVDVDGMYPSCGWNGWNGWNEWNLPQIYYIIMILHQNLQ